MTSDDTFPKEGQPNTKLISHRFTLPQLKRHLYWKFVTTKSIAVAGDISPERVRQILNGFDLPKTPQLINQLAMGWDVHPIKLTLCFERWDDKLREVETQTKQREREEK